MQPRDEFATRYAELKHEARESQQHIGSLTATLEADLGTELEPLLVAMIDGKRYVVDGHHRLAAYRSTMRQMVPVRTKAMNLRHAMLLSTLVNVTHRAMLLTSGQRAESLWRYLIEITLGGRRTLRKAGTSERKVMEVFGIRSKSTVGTMMKHMQFADELRKGDVVPERECNAVTGWPTWKHVCRRLRPEEGDTSQEADLKRRNKAAATLAAMVDDFGAAAVVAILREVVREANEDLGEEDKASEEEDPFA